MVTIIFSSVSVSKFMACKIVLDNNTNVDILNKKEQVFVNAISER